MTCDVSIMDPFPLGYDKILFESRTNIDGCIGEHKLLLGIVCCGGNINQSTDGTGVLERICNGAILAV